MRDIFENLRPSLIKILRHVDKAQDPFLILEKDGNTKYLFDNAFITGVMKGEEITNVSLTDKGFDALEYHDERKEIKRQELNRFLAPIIISVIALALTIWFNLEKILSYLEFIIEFFKSL
jgi:hypothetical protein